MNISLKAAENFKRDELDPIMLTNAARSTMQGIVLHLVSQAGEKGIEFADILKHMPKVDPGNNEYDLAPRTKKILTHLEKKLEAINGSDHTTWNKRRFYTTPGAVAQYKSVVKEFGVNPKNRIWDA